MAPMGPMGPHGTHGPHGLHGPYGPHGPMGPKVSMAHGGPMEGPMGPNGAEWAPREVETRKNQAGVVRFSYLLSNKGLYRTYGA